MFTLYLTISHRSRENRPIFTIRNGSTPTWPFVEFKNILAILKNNSAMYYNSSVKLIITCHSVHNINQNAVHSKIIKHRSKQSWTNKDYNTQFYRKTKWIFYGSPSHYGRSTFKSVLFLLINTRLFNTFQKHSADSKLSTNTYLISVAAVFQKL